MAKRIEFDIVAKVATGELDKLQNELADTLNSVNKLTGSGADIFKGTPDTLRKMKQSAAEIADMFSKQSFTPKMDDKQLTRYMKQVQRATGHMSKDFLQGAKDVGEISTRVRLLRTDIGKLEGTTNSLTFFSEAQMRNTERLKKSFDDLANARKRLDAISSSGKIDSNEFRDASREVDRLASAHSQLEREMEKHQKQGQTFANTAVMTKNRLEDLRRQYASLSAVLDEDELNEVFGKDFERTIKRADDAVSTFGTHMREYGADAIKASTANMKFAASNKDAMVSIKDLRAAMKGTQDEQQRVAQNIMRDVGSSRTALNSATAAYEKQEDHLTQITALSTRYANAQTRLTQIDLATTAALSKGNAEMKERKVLAAQLGSLKSDLMSSRNTLFARDTKLDQDLTSYVRKIDEALNKFEALSVARNAYATNTAEWKNTTEEMDRMLRSIQKYEAAIQKNRSNSKLVAEGLSQIDSELLQVSRRLDGLDNSFAGAFAHSALIAKVVADIRKLTKVAAELSDAFGKKVVAGIKVATTAMRGISGSAGSIFSGLSRALDGTGNAFRRFGDHVKSNMDRARDSMLAVTATGYSLMSIGNQVQMFGNMTFRTMSRGMDEYMDYERTRIQASIAAAELGPDGTMSVNNKLIDEIIFDMQSGGGNYTPEWMKANAGGRPIPVTFNAKDLAQGMYYYSAAIGLPMNEENAEIFIPTLQTIMQMAKVTNTDLESAIKGVMNIAMEFGYDPRAADQQLDMQKITAQTGYLANISTMEVSDIVEMFKMVGPMANQVAGGEAGAGLDDTFLLAFLASEVGLRGGNVGRGINQMFSGLLDPTAVMIEKMNKYFPEITDAASFRAQFFDGDRLKEYTDKSGETTGGILGFFKQLLDQGMTGANLGTMLSEMFTNNATRAALGPMIGLQDGTISLGGQEVPLAEFFERMEEDPLRWLSVAAAETANSVSGWFDYMKNSWFQFQSSIVNSIKGPIMGSFRAIGEFLFTFARLINDNPIVGKFLAGFVTFIATIASIGGTALIAAGAIMILTRSIATMGGIVLPVIHFFLTAGLALGVLIPVLLGIALAIGIVSRLWARDVGGMRTKFEEFKASLFSQDLGHMFDGLVENLIAGFAVFNAIIDGVIFGNKDALGAFGAWLNRTFGPMLADAMFQPLMGVNDKIKDMGNSIKNSVPIYRSGIASINDYGLALRGLAEQTLFGEMSKEAERGLFNISVAFGQNYHEVRENLNGVADTLRYVIAYVINAGRQIGTTWRSITDEIYANLMRILQIGSVSELFDRLGQFADGFVTGLSDSISVLLNGIELITEGIARLVENFQGMSEASTEIFGITLRMSDAFRNLGLLLGTLFGVRLIMTFGPLMGVFRVFIPMVFSLGAAFVGITGRILVAAAAAAIFAARIVLVGTVSIVFGILTASLNLLTFAFAATTAAALGFAAAALGILGIGAVLAGIAFVVIGVTQGFSAAANAARAFVSGVIDGFMPFGRIIFTIVAVLAAVAKAFMELIGLGGDLISVSRTLGVVLGAVFGALLLRAIVSILMSIGALVLAIGGVPLAAALAIATVVVVFGEWSGTIDTIISGLTTVVDLLNKISVGGIGAGDALVGAGLIAATKPGRGILGKVGAPVARVLGSAVQAHPIAAGVIAATAFGGYSVYRDMQSPYVWDGQGIPEGQKEGLMDSHLSYSKNMSDYTRSDEFLALAPEQRRMAVLQEQYRQVQAGNVGGFKWDENDPNYINSVNPKVWDVYDNQQNTMAAMDRTKSLIGIPTAGNLGGNKNTETIAGVTRTQRKASQEAGQDNAGWFTDGFVGFLKASGSYDMVNSIAEGMDIDLDNLKFSDLTKLQTELLKVPETASLMKDYDMLDWLPNGTEYKEAAKDWEQFNGLVKELMKSQNMTIEEATDEAKRLYQSWGVDIPSNPGDYSMFNDTAEAVAQAEADAEAKLEETKKAWEQAAQDWYKVSPEELFGTLFDPFAGPDNKSLISWMAGPGFDAIMKNVPEGAAPWMNQTEFMADFAVGGGMNFAGEGVYGQNMHSLLRDSGALDALSQQTGIPIDVLLVGVPKFQAPEEFQSVAIADMVGMIGGLDQHVAEWLDLSFGRGVTIASTGITQDFTAAGMDWAELNSFAIGQALSGQDWNLADYISESWGISIADANAYLAANGIDPNIINDDMYALTEQAALSGSGAFNVLTDEMYSWLSDATGKFSTNIIEMTESEFMAMDDATKAILTRMGYTFVVNDYIPPEALAKARSDVDALSKTIIDGLNSGEYAMIAGGADWDMSGLIETWDEIGRSADGLWVTLQDLDGTQVTIPAAEYDAYMASMDTIKQATAEWQAMVDNLTDKTVSIAIKFNTPSTNTAENYSDYLGALGEMGNAYNNQESIMGQGAPTTNASLGIPDELSVNVKFTVADVPEADMSAALGVPIVDGAGTVTVKMITEGFSEAADAAGKIKDALSGFTTGGATRINVITSGVSEAIDAIGTSLNGAISLVAKTHTVWIWTAGVNEATQVIGVGLNNAIQAVAKTHTVTIWTSGISEATTAVSGLKTLVGSVAKVWTVTVSTLVFGAGAVANLLDSLNNLPTTKNVTVNTYRNEIVSRYDKGVTTTATGGRIGSAGLQGRYAGNYDVMSYTGQYQGVVGRATGGRTQNGELTLVGEQGPELVGLSTGSFVMTARQTERLFREGQAGQSTAFLLNTANQDNQGANVTINNESTTININGPINIGDRATADDFFAEIDRRSGREQQMARRGMRPAGEFS